MTDFIELFKNLADPAWIMQNGGLYLVTLIIFAETGILIGFFLPGDPLLFISGIVIANTSSPFDSSPLNLLYWVLLVSFAGIAGNYLAYWLGKKWGHLLLNKKDTWLFKKKYLEQAKEFYEKKGGSSLILARFIPVIRTFAPVIAGIVNMEQKKFSFYNITGSFIWVGSIVTAGYLLGEHSWVKDNLEFIIIGIVLLASAPVLVKMIAGWIKRKKMVPVTETVTDKNEPNNKRSV